VSGTTQTIGRRLNGDFATGMARRTKGSGEREGTFGTGMERIGLSPESLSKGSFAEGMMRAPTTQACTKAPSPKGRHVHAPPSPWIDPLVTPVAKVGREL
jgi:hypothetical protein